MAVVIQKGRPKVLEAWLLRIIFAAIKVLKPLLRRKSSKQPEARRGGSSL